VNVYDFDGTLYAGDSTADFIAFLMRRHPELLSELPAIGLAFGRLALKRCTKTVTKERLYRMFTRVPDMEGEVVLFWKTHRKNLKKWYQTTKKPDDLVISASPEFLVIPGCALLGINRVMASRVDMKTGRYTGVNCHGKEKITRLEANFPGERVEDFYSDSHADDPLAAYAQRAFMVRGEKLSPWKMK